MDKEWILRLAEKEDSFYLYNEQKILEHTEALKRAFPEIAFLYSVKTNPHPLVTKAVLSSGFGLDAASFGEVRIGEQQGLKKEEILYSSPGKTDKDLEQAIDRAVIIVDSLGEWARLEKIAKRNHQRIKMGARINPDFSMDGDQGLSGKFGIDEALFFEALKERKDSEYLDFIGIHVHSRSQELKAEVLGRYYRLMFDLAVRVQEVSGSPLEFINLGGGIGIAYGKEDLPLDLEDLGARTGEFLKKLRTKMPKVKVYIETGRFAVGQAGIYVTKVIDKKVSYGKTYVILNNTLNGFIRPSLAMLVTGYGGDRAKANEPLFTQKDAFGFEVLSKSKEEETVNLFGNLCTGTDVVAREITLPKIEEGDLVIMHNAGSYAAALTPMQFASLDRPKEFFLTKEGEIVMG